MGKNPEPGRTSRILFVKTLYQFLGLEYLNSLMLIRIRDLVNPKSGEEKIGSGMEKIGSVMEKTSQIRNTAWQICLQKLIFTLQY
jgi:hypothetical protein